MIRCGFISIGEKDPCSQEATHTLVFKMSYQIGTEMPYAFLVSFPPHCLKHCEELNEYAHGRSVTIIQCSICSRYFDEEWRSAYCPHDVFVANDFTAYLGNYPPHTPLKEAVEEN